MMRYARRATKGQLVVAAVVVALLVTACASGPSGPPAIELDATPCDHCGMLVSELAFAAATRDGDGRARVYDDIGCLLDATSRSSEPAARVWVKDFETLEWLGSESAIFVRSDAIQTPMGGGIAAFADRRAAEKLAITRGGDVLVGLPSLRAAYAQGGAHR